jgi:hypothetical protein
MKIENKQIMKIFYKGSLNTDYKKSLRLPKNQQEWLVGNFDQFNNTLRKTSLLELKYWRIKKGNEKDY